MRHTIAPSLRKLSRGVLLLYLAIMPTSAMATTQRELVPLASLTDDYTVHLKNRVAWMRRSLRICFVRDAEYTDARVQAAQAGFDYWVTATRGYMVYQVVDDPEDAQVTVRFDPATNDGYTTTTFRKGSLLSARIHVGVQRAWRSDIACIAAHEFGHAIGINGHSDVASDLMYPIHRMGRPCAITTRDLNTLAAVYEVGPEVRVTWRPLIPHGAALAL